MSNKLGWVAVLGLALLQCGGKSVTTIDSDDSASDGNDVSAAGSGGAASTDECDDAGLSESGCAGEAGDNPVQPYAGVRTGCQQGAHVDRNGKPVPICFHIH